MQTNDSLLSNVFLHANESPFPMDEKIKVRLKEGLDAFAFGRYPDAFCDELCEAYAKYAGVRSDQVLCGNGSDELIDLLIRRYGQRGAVYTFAKDFSMYAFYAKEHGAKFVTFDWELKDEFDVKAFIEKGKACDAELIIFSNPNNPTGRIINKEDVIRIISQFPNSVIAIDEAYVEFWNDGMAKLLTTCDNVFILRTLSKAYALAGLRCGFALGSKKNIADLKDHKAPYTVNRFTQFAAITLLSNMDGCFEKIAYTKEERERVMGQLLQMFADVDKKELYIMRSYGNFIYMEGKLTKRIKNRLKEQNIIVRAFNFGAIRITIGMRWENDLVLEVFERIRREL